jgi:hypothetical protein
MYQVISWDPADTARPVVQRTKGITELCRLIYAAGKAQHDVVIDEYSYDRDDGEQFEGIFDSTEA